MSSFGVGGGDREEGPGRAVRSGEGPGRGVRREWTGQDVFR